MSEVIYVLGGPHGGLDRRIMVQLVNVSARMPDKVLNHARKGPFVNVRDVGPASQAGRSCRKEKKVTAGQALAIQATTVVTAKYSVYPRSTQYNNHGRRGNVGNAGRGAAHRGIRCDHR
jgi:hypothetical protein